MYTLLPSPRRYRPRISGLGTVTNDLIMVAANVGAGALPQGVPGATSTQDPIGDLWDGVKKGSVSSATVNAAAQEAAAKATSAAKQYIPQAQTGSKAWDLAAAGAATAATAAFASTGVMAPVAPIAGIVAAGMVNAFKPRPAPPFDVGATTSFWVHSYGDGQCADQQCWNDLNAIIRPVFDEFQQYHSLDCSVKSKWFGLSHEGPSDPGCMVDAAALADQRMQDRQGMIAEALAKSRLRVEIAFLEKVKKNADAIRFQYQPRCYGSPACIQTVQGIALRAAFDPAVEARSGNLTSARLKAEAALQELEGTVLAQKRDYGAQLEKARDGVNDAQSAKTKRRIAIALLALTVAGVGAAYVAKRTRT